MFSEIIITILNQIRIHKAKLLNFEVQNHYLQSSDINHHWYKNHITGKVCKIKLQLLALSPEQQKFFSQYCLNNLPFLCQLEIGNVYSLNGDFYIQEYKVLSKSIETPYAELTLINRGELNYVPHSEVQA